MVKHQDTNLLVTNYIVCIRTGAKQYEKCISFFQ